MSRYGQGTWISAPNRTAELEGIKRRRCGSCTYISIATRDAGKGTRICEGKRATGKAERVCSIHNRAASIYPASYHSIATLDQCAIVYITLITYARRKKTIDFLEQLEPLFKPLQFQRYWIFRYWVSTRRIVSLAEIRFEEAVTVISRDRFWRSNYCEKEKPNCLKGNGRVLWRTIPSSQDLRIVELPLLIPKNWPSVMSNKNIVLILLLKGFISIEVQTSSNKVTKKGLWKKLF